MGGNESGVGWGGGGRGLLACCAPSAELLGEAVVRRVPQEVSGMERGLSY